MPRFMNINIVTITSDLIFKCFTLQPILESKRIIPFNPTTISNPQQRGSLYNKSTTKSFRLKFFQCLQVLFSDLPTGSHRPRSSPWVGRINIINVSCIELYHIRTDQITIEMSAYQWIFPGLNRVKDRAIFVTRMQ